MVGFLIALVFIVTMEIIEKVYEYRKNKGFENKLKTILEEHKQKCINDYEIILKKYDEIYKRNSGHYRDNNNHYISNPNIHQC